MFLAFTAFSQKKSLSFPANTNVCFVGNSITQNGEYLHYIRSFYATRFPDKQVNFFNCGISGDVTGGILARMEPDIMVNKPDYAVIMIGMNDVNRPLYSAKRAGEDSIAYKKAQALATYKSNLEKIIRYFLDHHVKVILQKPSIYDQTAALPSENLKGANDALGTCAGYMQAFAGQYNLPVVDYWNFMNELNKQLQQKDSTATIVGADRVHPGSTGHFAMAWQFLHTTLGDQPVAKIILDHSKRKLVEVANCGVKDLHTTRQAIQFQYTPLSLPFYVSKEAAPALQWLPFTNALNKEWLQVKDLPAGTYNLYMNDTLLSTFSHKQLREGINLANLNTPQYKQAQAVVNFCMQYRAAENELRQLRHMEYRNISKYEYGTNADSARAWLTRRSQDPALKASDRSAAEKYLKNKKNEGTMIQSLAIMRQQLYKMNRPSTITVRIEAQ